MNLADKSKYLDVWWKIINSFLRYDGVETNRTAEY